MVASRKSESPSKGATKSLPVSEKLKLVKKAAAAPPPLDTPQALIDQAKGPLVSRLEVIAAATSATEKDQLWKMTSALGAIYTFLENPKLELVSFPLLDPIRKLIFELATIYHGANSRILIASNTGNKNRSDEDMRLAIAAAATDALREHTKLSGRKTVAETAAEIADLFGARGFSLSAKEIVQARYEFRKGNRAKRLGVQFFRYFQDRYRQLFFDCERDALEFERQVKALPELDSLGHLPPS